MPFPGETRRKGSEKREIKRNPLPLGLARSQKRQRKSRKPPKTAAFPGRDKAKRQRKKGNLAKSAAFRAGKKPKKAAKIEETAGICCLSRARQGEKAT